MAYLVEVAPAAERQIKKLTKAVQRQALAAIQELAQNPRPGGARALQGNLKGLLRIEFGPKKDYRIVYQVRDDVLTVLVVKVADRKQVYK